MKLQLKAPIPIGDKSVSELELNIDAITGGDIMFCVQEASAIKGVVVSYRIDTEVHLQMVCKLTGIARAALLKMNGHDFNELLGPVYDFFLASD